MSAYQLEQVINLDYEEDSLSSPKKDQLPNGQNINLAATKNSIRQIELTFTNQNDGSKTTTHLKQDNTINIKDNADDDDDDDDDDEGQIYDPDKRPFDLEEALVHQRASMTYQSFDQQELKQLRKKGLKICRCCSYPEAGSLIPVGDSIKSLAHLGPAFPLYFQFIKFSLGQILIIFFMSSLYLLFIAYDGKKCEKNSTLTDISKACQMNYLQTLSTANIDSTEPDTTAVYLNFFCAVVLMIYNLFYRYFQHSLEYEVDQADVSVSDYTVQFMNLPFKDKKVKKQEFIDWLDFEIENQIKKEVTIVKEATSFAYIIDEYSVNKAQYEELIKELTIGNEKYGREGYKNELGEAQYAQMMEDIAKYKKLCNDYENLCEESDTFEYCNGTVFVSFMTETMAIDVLQYFEPKADDCCKFGGKRHSQIFFKEREITCIPAPECGDIVWENLEIDWMRKKKKRLMSKLYTLGILILCFCLIFAISLYQETFTGQVAQLIVGLVSSVLIVIINQVLNFALKKLAKGEYYITETNYFISLTTKMGVSQYLNTALITFLVKLLRHGSDLWVQGGMVFSISLIFISNSIVPTLMEGIDPDQIRKRIQQWYYIKYPKERINLSQKEANAIFENKKMDPSVRYANDVKTLLLAAFYSYLIPAGTLLTCVSFIFAYNTNKYNLLRRQSRPIPLGPQISQRMIDDFLDLIIVVFCAGNVLWEYMVYGQYHGLTLASLVISGAYWIAPMEKVQERMCYVQSRHVETEDYESSKKKLSFETSYTRSNPITMQKATLDYLLYCIENTTGKSNKKQMEKLQFMQNKFNQNFSESPSQPGEEMLKSGKGGVTGGVQSNGGIQIINNPDAMRKDFAKSKVGSKDEILNSTNSNSNKNQVMINQPEVLKPETVKIAATQQQRRSVTGQKRGAGRKQ